MQRVLIIGSGGAGKSTLAKQLGEITGLPVIHLDTHYWKPGWIATPNKEWWDRVDQLAEQESWIMDGNYTATLYPRLAACDTVIFLDLPRSVCLFRVIVRRIRYHRRSRPDMAEGCHERLDWQFLKWVWVYQKTKRPWILRALEGVAEEKTIFRLRSTKAIATILEDLRQTIA